ncbi:MAG: nicotinate (nicotinamide) nucleotide adenylyltransferase [Elusimicrobia bacterium]|nr:nicotinate (nicotinamide) nucleotide adenylyltransferase [Elusimicrobiota bacterium]
MKILIYGGVFDPPHKGHFSLLKSAAIRIKPDIIFIAPAWKSPFKPAPLASFTDRAAMLKLGLGRLPQNIKKTITIHPFEFKRKKTTYTSEVLKYFSKKYPASKLYFLIGSDCLKDLGKWKNLSQILKLSTIAVGIRKGFGACAANRRNSKPPRQFGWRGGEFLALKGRFPPISSSKIRTRICAGYDPSGMPEPVENYIFRKGLYFSRVIKRLKKYMTPSRLAHAVSSANLGMNLAEKYGINRGNAALSLLFHDIAKGFSSRRLIRYVSGNRIRVPHMDKIISRNPRILHSYAGAHITEKIFKIKNRKILNAVKFHTLGRARMPLLDKIVYVADMACETRSFPLAEKIRKLAFKDINLAFKLAIRTKLNHVRNNNKEKIM